MLYAVLFCKSLLLKMRILFLGSLFLKCSLNAVLASLTVAKGNMWTVGSVYLQSYCSVIAWFSFRKEETC